MKGFKTGAEGWFWKPASLLRIHFSFTRTLKILRLVKSLKYAVLVRKDKI